MKPITKVKIKQDGDTWTVTIRNNLKLNVRIEGIPDKLTARQQARERLKELKEARIVPKKKYDPPVPPLPPSPRHIDSTTPK